MDEVIICFKDSERSRELVEELVMESIYKVNDDFLLRRDLGCDCQFGKRYSNIH